MPEELDVVFEAALQNALNFLSERGFNRELRQEQKSSVKQLFTGGDLLAVLPTGFGKSLIFQLLALVNDDYVVLVICPLKSIVNDQIKEASSIGISAGSLSDCLQTDIVSGKYRLLFASADEALAYIDCVNRILCHNMYSRNDNSLNDNLVAGNTYENIFRLGFKNNLDLEAAFGKIVYVQILVNIIVIFFLRCLKPFREDFPLFVFVAGDNTRTDFRIGLFPSGVSSKRLFAEVDFGGVAAVNSVILPCNDSWTNEYSDPRFRIFRAQGLQTRLKCLSHFTTVYLKSSSLKVLS